MKQIEISDKRTVEDAIEEGLAKLAVGRDSVEIEILSAGGLFSKPKVRLTVKDTAGRRALIFTEKLIELMNINAVVELDEKDDEAKLNIIGTDAGAVIGYRGEVLDAIQYLASIVANLDSGKESYKRITADSENYRDKRAETLEALAERMVAKALTTGRRVALDPMNPYERRIIHVKLQDSEEVTAHSEGEEPNRYLIIVPKNEKPFEKTYRDNGYKNKYNNDNKSGYNKNNSDNRSGYNKNNSDNRSGYNKNNSDNKSGYNKSGYNKNVKSNGFGQSPFFTNSGFSESDSKSGGFSESDLKSGKNYTANTKYNKD